MQFSSAHLVSRSARLAALAVLTAVLAGCQSIAGIQPTTQVRVINVSPDAPALDIYQNSSAGLYNVGFGTVSSYMSVAAGSYTHAAYTTGTQQQLANVRGSFLSGNQYTVLAGNVAANMQMTVLRDQAFAAPNGQVALRFLDQATRVGPIDIYLVSPGSAHSKVAPIDTGLGFGGNTGYINAPSGTYSIVAVPSGVGSISTVSPLYTGSQISYASGSAHTIVLIDQQPSSASGLQVISASDYDSASN